MHWYSKHTTSMFTFFAAFHIEMANFTPHDDVFCLVGYWLYLDWWCRFTENKHWRYDKKIKVSLITQMHNKYAHLLLVLALALEGWISPSLKFFVSLIIYDAGMVDAALQRAKEIYKKGLHWTPNTQLACSHSLQPYSLRWKILPFLKVHAFLIIVMLRCFLQLYETLILEVYKLWLHLYSKKTISMPTFLEAWHIEKITSLFEMVCLCGYWRFWDGWCEFMQC